MCIPSSNIYQRMWEREWKKTKQRKEERDGSDVVEGVGYESRYLALFRYQTHTRVCVRADVCCGKVSITLFHPICLHTAFFRICLSAHVLPHRAHLSMPLLGCNVETAVAIVADEHEQVFAAGLHQHLLQCRPRTRVCKCAIVNVYVFVCMRGVGTYVCTCVCVRRTLRSYCIMSVNSRVCPCVGVCRGGWSKWVHNAEMCIVCVWYRKSARYRDSYLTPSRTLLPSLSSFLCFVFFHSRSHIL